MLRHIKGLSGLSILLVVVSLICGNAATGQTSTTSLHGTVIDINGASVPDATLTLTNTEIGVTLTEKTDKEGAYRFLEVRPATYVLTVTASGFATYKQTQLQLLVGTPATQDADGTTGHGVHAEIQLSKRLNFRGRRRRDLLVVAAFCFLVDAFLVDGRGEGISKTDRGPCETAVIF